MGGYKLSDKLSGTSSKPPLKKKPPPNLPLKKKPPPNLPLKGEAFFYSLPFREGLGVGSS